MASPRVAAGSARPECVSFPGHHCQKQVDLESRPAAPVLGSCLSSTRQRLLHQLRNVLGRNTLGSEALAAVPRKLIEPLRSFQDFHMLHGGAQERAAIALAEALDK